MSDEEFLWKLRKVLIAMSEIWYEPQWYVLNDELIAQQYGYVTLDDAQVSFARAESLLNPSGELQHVGTRIEKWKKSYALKEQDNERQSNSHKQLPHTHRHDSENDK